ncbi:MAG: helix-turn-helix transcriptional regulator [Bdellovibrionales bacterium]|nr:helix-turn-helix transcriptional regulator [Bdellovibrionales bacterium]
MDRSGDACQIGLVLELIGGRWKGPIIYWLQDGTKRFGELRRLLDGITQRTLTTQLRELERNGLVTRTQYPEVPPRVEYQATDLCRSLVPLLDSMRAWAETYGDRIIRQRQHPDPSPFDS